MRRIRTHLFWLASLASTVFLLAPTPTGAVVVPPGFENRQLATLSLPTGLAFTPDGRLLITTKNGRLRLFQDGVLQSTPVIDLSPQLCTNLDRGLLGVALGPDFSDSHYVYLFYTHDRGSDSCGTDPKNLDATPVNRISRFVLEGTAIDPSSERVLVDNIPSLGVHSAGDLQFGKDGHLYATTGDGGCDYIKPDDCRTSNGASRYPHALVGKVLRITSEGGIPTDNPYLGPGTTRCNVAGRATPGLWCQEIYASGLRNPFRFAFDDEAPLVRFFINDVGSQAWEEINLGLKGADYGWNLREGHCAVASTTDCGPPPSGMTSPIFDYDHSKGCASVTAGAFVPSGAWPSTYDGSYLFGDYVCESIFQLTAAPGGGYTATELASGVGGIISMAFGPGDRRNELHYLTWADPPGLHSLTFTGSANRRPNAVARASPTAGRLPLDVAFDARESSDPDGDALTYEWDFGDGSPRQGGLTITHRYGRAGTFTATLAVSDNAGAADQHQIRIDAGNLPPTPAILSPTPDAVFRVDETITLRGTATDPEDGTLSGAALTWEVVKHHATHVHPFLAPTSGDQASITAPEPEDLSSTTNSYLEIRLTATDSKGLSKTVTQDLRPQLVDLDLLTSPPGLRLEVNGVTAPASVTSWEGWDLRLYAPHPQWDHAGTGHTFRSWSDGGAQTHTVTTPRSDTAYVARFTSRYARPKAAKKARVTLVPAYRQCLSTNRGHGPPLDRPSCGPPNQATRFATVGTPDANGLPARSIGRVQLKVVTGNPATAENEADVGIRVHLTGLLDRGAGHYAGDIAARIAVRLTDRHNGTSGRDSGTTVRMPVSITARCAPDLTVGGSTCRARTSMNALLPGAVREGRRAIWELGAVRVFDGGADGDVATADNGLLARQGVFVP